MERHKAGKGGDDKINTNSLKNRKNNKKTGKKTEKVKVKER